MKNTLLFTLLILLTVNSLKAQCPQLGFVFFTQGEVDSFSINYPNCTEISGGISIGSSINETEISNLAGLSQIVSLGGGLSVSNNNSLVSLSGLEGLQSIGGHLFIKDNPALNDLSALSNITSAVILTIENNDALENLSGLENLSSITGEENEESIRIAYNDALVDISALDPTGIIHSIAIFFNPVLATITSFSSIDHILEYCIISNNEQLTEISGFNSVKTIVDPADPWLFNWFSINENDALVNISGFNSLETVYGKFEMLRNPVLSSLNGFTSLDSLTDGFHVSNCNALEDFLEFTSLTYLGENVKITDNPSLNTCAFPALCNYIFLGGVPEISNNAGCPNLSDLFLACFAETTIVMGSVYNDANANCLVDSAETPLDNWLVNASNDDYSYTVSTDSLGNYLIPLLEGVWDLNFIAPSTFWSSCLEDSLVVSNSSVDTVVLDGIVSSQGDCPYLEWEFSTTPLRVCTTSTYLINYCNYGSQAAIDHVFSVFIDNDFTFVDAALPHTIDANGIIHFEIDSIGVLDCGQISFTAMSDCDNVQIGDIACFEVFLNPEDLCSSNSDWDESTITANGYCTNDSIFFELENIGIGNMSEAEQFIIEIVIDDIVLLQDADDYQLASGEKKMISYKKDGLGMRLETQQSPDHPVGGTVSIVVPNCDSDSNNVLLTLLPIGNTGNPFSGKTCIEVVGSYDPNIKSVIPEGVGPNHEIDKDWTLDYMIEFQNTGNDTAFLVVLKDTLSENLDLSTIQVKGASHNFTWNLNPDRELVFTFENILLVDSFTNEPGSHGFVRFEITPSTHLIPGDSIENRAGIYFDFNDPIITNTVWHTIRKPVVASSEQTDWCAGDEYNGWEVSQDTTFQYSTEFIEYDSVHFVHLDVNPIADSMVMAEVLVGEYLNDVLINGDTIFTVSHINQLGCDSLVTYTVTALLTSIHASNIYQQTKVFPNPVNGQLYILDHQNGEAQDWTISNNLGQVIWSKTLLAEAQISPIEISHFLPGVYWLKVNTKGSTAVWRIVKQ